MHAQVKLKKQAWEKVYEVRGADNPPLRKDKVYPNETIERLDNTPEALDWLRGYVRAKLIESGASFNPKQFESLVAHIVGDAWKQYDSIYFANLELNHAIEFARKHPYVSPFRRYLEMRAQLREEPTSL